MCDHVSVVLFCCVLLRLGDVGFVLGSREMLCTELGISVESVMMCMESSIACW